MLESTARAARGGAPERSPLARALAALGAAAAGSGSRLCAACGRQRACVYVREDGIVKMRCCGTACSVLNQWCHQLADAQTGCSRHAHSFRQDFSSSFPGTDGHAPAAGPRGAALAGRQRWRAACGIPSAPPPLAPRPPRCPRWHPAAQQHDDSSALTASKLQ